MREIVCVWCLAQNAADTHVSNIIDMCMKKIIVLYNYI